MEGFIVNDGKKYGKHAILSVSNKVGIEGLASGLVKLGIGILSTGGTAKTLRKAGIEVMDVSEYTGFPEIMDGRVKTLHPKVYGGLLGRIGIPHHDAAMQEHDMVPIDFVIVNLYPFQQTIAKPGCTREEAIEDIDIGGPTMIRAAAKNHERVTVVVDPADYSTFLTALLMTPDKPETSILLRRAFAKKAFDHTSMYDQAIARYL